MPTGHVFRWHLRIMTQPLATSGAVAKPNSSAPSSAAIATSRPVFSCPSTCKTTRDAEPVQYEDLLRLGEPDLPRRARVLDRRQRRRARPAVVTGDEDHVGVRLRDARRDGADAALAHELHADARLRVHVLQIEDELREILDRIDVVVRRRRDERHARRRVTDAGDFARHFVPGELAALAGLRALRHLDLQLVGVDEVVRRHAEARARDLLDRAPLRVAVRERARSARRPRPLRRCSTCRRCGSSRPRGSRAPRG